MFPADPEVWSNSAKLCLFNESFAVAVRVAARAWKPAAPETEVKVAGVSLSASKSGSLTAWEWLVPPGSKKGLSIG